MSRFTFSLVCVAALLLVASRAVPLEEEKSSTVNGLEVTSSTSTLTAATVTDASTVPAASGATTKPKYLTADNVPVCKQSNPNLGDCVQRIFQLMLPRFKNGIKELNIPALDPFVLNRTTLQASFGPVTGRVTLKNGFIHGLSNLVYKKVDLKFVGDKLKTLVRSHIPLLHIVGQYKADAKVNNARIRPKGTFNLTLTDVNVKTVSDSVFYENDGHRFVRLLNFDAFPTVSDMKVDITGIFEDPELNEVVVSFMNQYWREIYTVLLPETRTYWAPLVLRAVNEAFTVVPFDNFVKDE